MTTKFKIGDKVKFANSHCVAIDEAQDEWPKTYKVIAIENIGNGADKIRLDAKWDNGGWSWSDDDFILIEADTNELDKLYNPTEEGWRLTNSDTVIYKAKRRRENQDQYVIKYAQSKQSVACIQKQDLLSLAALLIKIAGEN